MTQDAASKSASQLHVSPFYIEARNEITQPGHFVACSRYFVEKWIPRLGSTAVSLVLTLRGHGYYNPRTGERRDGIQISLKELATACACSERTLQRELDRNESLQKFVRVETSYTRTDGGQIRHLENVYRIAMDDPLIPEDEPRLQEIIEARGRTTDDERRTTKRVKQPPIAARIAASEPVLELSLPMDDKLSCMDANPVNDILSCMESGPSVGDKMSFTAISSVGDNLSSSNEVLDIPSSQDIPSQSNNNSAPAQLSAQPGSTDVVVALAGCSIPETAVAMLVRHGISQSVAEDIASRHSNQEIEEQIEALAYRGPKDPAAVLVRAIRDRWALPAGYVTAKSKRESKERREEELVRRRSEEAFAKTEELQRARSIEVFWSELAPADRSGIEEQARELLRRENPFLAARMERGAGGVVLQASLNAIRERLLAERLGLGPPQDRAA